MGATELVAGAVFAGYVIERRLGAGGMGTVYLARHPELEMPVALKVLEPVVADAAGAAQFRREAQLVANLQHPNIVDIKGFGDDHGVLWMAMRYVPGGDLADLIDENPCGIDPARAVRMVAAVADALDYAHANQVVHRDVKPANIFRTTGTGGADWVLIGDFGIARSLAAGETQTASGRWAFSQPYAPPEQRVGRPAGPRADVHALAVTLYQLVTGELPSELPIPERDSRLPGTLGAVLAKATAWNPADRQASCGELAAAAALALHRTARRGIPAVLARRAAERRHRAATEAWRQLGLGERLPTAPEDKGTPADGSVRPRGTRRRTVTIAAVTAAVVVGAAVIVVVLQWNSAPARVAAGSAPSAPISARCVYTATVPVAPGLHAVVPVTGDGGRRCLLSGKDAAQGPLEGVKTLQSALRTCYSVEIADVDGIFGADTKRAVLTVQERHAITRDGVFGPQTSAAMNWPVYNDDNVIQPPCRTVSR
ncbi:serine/threonine-protein kinase [Nocardia seriolae]|uniref:non-specific serine/threonine protein kinase n=2 Tax=Nocardia seriolae TaxID=37332 RepID=A0ABC9YVN0_9NOCA|nr:serine/threonine-protein kinase [Nocardia seriolae]BEK97149.1 hypothetical protein NSER024013_50550 [Nocardia seriolae]GAM47577.1 serine/threonine protein kinase [Nocardia seriolae]GAP29445.1 serine/threonine protein kinase [Nocardia seriolae]